MTVREHAAAEELMAALEPVHVAQSPAEREAIYRFRYTVYVEELGRKLGNADHERRWVYDPEDDQPYTTLLYTATDDVITGTVRLRHWKPGEVPQKDFDAFSMEKFPGLDRLGTAEMGRLMVRADARGQLLLAALVAHGYEMAVQEWGTRLAFANCATGLVRHYGRLGLRPYAGRLVPTPDGIEVPLVMVVSDLAHFEQVGSYLSLLVPRHFGPGALEPVDATAYAPLFDPAAMPVEVEADAVWSRVREELGLIEGQASFLAQLSPATVELLSGKGFLLTVPAGELLTEKGLGQRELFVVLDGAFEAFDGERTLRLMTSGDVIGEIAFFHTSGKRTASVRALSDGQVLVVRRRFVDELIESDPAAAAEILMQLARVLADRATPAG
jgi:Cyclic nucleotide-binding domain/Acetyltransferase (GNAT) domain